MQQLLPSCLRLQAHLSLEEAARGQFCEGDATMAGLSLTSCKSGVWPGIVSRPVRLNRRQGGGRYASWHAPTAARLPGELIQKERFMLIQLVNILYVLIAIAIIALVLLQQGDGAQAGSGFGGGASGTVFGARGSTNFLSKSTKWLAVTFFVISLGMAMYASRQANRSGPVGAPDLGVMGQPAAAGTPATPAPAAAGPQIPPAPAQPAPQAPAATVPAASPTSAAPAAPAPAPATPAPAAPAQGN